MRDYNFAFVGQRNRQLGGAGGGGANPQTSMFYAAGNPSAAKYKSLFRFTENDAAKLRATGAWAATPKLVKWTSPNSFNNFSGQMDLPKGIAFDMGIWTQLYSASPNVEQMPGCTGVKIPSGGLLSATTTGTRLGMSVVDLNPNLGAADPLLSAIYFTSTAIFQQDFPFLPWPQTVGGPVVTTAATPAGGASTYERVKRHPKTGNFVIFGTTGPPLKYGATLAAVAPGTACTVPALNDASGNPGHNKIIWVDSDGDDLLALTRYGELLISTDGITWTKTLTRAAGGTTYDMGYFDCYGGGRVVAAGNANFSPFVIPAYNAADWTWLAPSIPGLVMGDVAFCTGGGVAGSQGVIMIAYQRDWDAAGTTKVALAVSFNHGATWTSVLLQSEINNAFKMVSLVANNGLFLVNQRGLTGGVTGWRWFLIWATFEAAAYLSPTGQILDTTGASNSPYINR